MPLIKDMRKAYDSYSYRNLRDQYNQSVEDGDEPLREELESVMNDNTFIRSRPDYQDALQEQTRNKYQGRFATVDDYYAARRTAQQAYDRQSMDFALDNSIDDDAPEPDEPAELKELNALYNDKNFLFNEFVAPIIEERKASYQAPDTSEVISIVSRAQSRYTVDQNIVPNSDDVKALNEIHYNLVITDKLEEFDDAVVDYFVENRNLGDYDYDDEPESRITGNPKRRKRTNTSAIRM